MDTLTDKQRRIWELYQELGSNAKAARALGVNATVVDRQMKSIRKKLAVMPKVGTSLPTVSNRTGKRIMVLPDVQAKPGTDFSFLRRIGLYMVEKQPDVVVCIGDFWDYPSLSSFDKGKKAFEGRRYKRDVEAGQFAMQAFLGPLEDYRKAGGTWWPRMVFTTGNHEHRVMRAIEDDPKLEGAISLKDMALEEYGWEVHPFLEVVVIEGIAFSHYFTTGVMGRPAGTAAAQLRKCGMSAVAGHQQGKQIAYGYRADGSTVTSIIAGSCYEHSELYLGAQGNNHWRGFLVLNEVANGSFDELWVSLNYINSKYPDVRYETPAYSLPTEAEMQAGRM